MTFPKLIPFIIEDKNKSESYPNYYDILQVCSNLLLKVESKIEIHYTKIIVKFAQILFFLLLKFEKIVKFISSDLNYYDIPSILHFIHEMIKERIMVINILFRCKRLCHSSIVNFYY